MDMLPKVRVQMFSSKKDGVLYTPPPGNILPGITRATVIDIARSLNIPVEQKLFTTEELKEADAAFYCGTAAEVIGWESIDDVRFPLSWKESKGRIIEEAYKNLVIEKDFQTKATNKIEKELAEA